MSWKIVSRTYERMPWDKNGYYDYERMIMTSWCYGGGRDIRMRMAKCLGRHTEAEWREIAHAALACAGCGFDYMRGRRPTKDHIIPISRGGCDCIQNIQPLCQRCNSRKGKRSLDAPKDHPFMRRTGFKYSAVATMPRGLEDVDWRPIETPVLMSD